MRQSLLLVALAAPLTIAATDGLAEPGPQPGIGGELGELGCSRSRSQPAASDGSANLAGAHFLRLAQAVFTFDLATGGLQRSLAEVSGAQDAMKDELDSLSGLSEEEELRLQLVMDRLAKFMNTLSNVTKRNSDTQNAIVQNFK